MADYIGKGSWRKGSPASGQEKFRVADRVCQLCNWQGLKNSGEPGSQLHFDVLMATSVVTQGLTLNVISWGGHCSQSCGMGTAVSPVGWALQSVLWGGH